jgi:hypothetical protein
MMPETSGERIFISYSRKDGAEFAASLRKRLQKENLSIWQDLIALEGGRGLVEPDRRCAEVKGSAAFYFRHHPGGLGEPSRSAGE